MNKMLPVVAAIGAAVVAIAFSENEKKKHQDNNNVIRDAMNHGYDVKYSYKGKDSYGNSYEQSFEFTRPEYAQQAKPMKLFMFVDGCWRPATFTVDGYPLPDYNPAWPMSPYQLQIYNNQLNGIRYFTQYFQEPESSPDVINVMPSVEQMVKINEIARHLEAYQIDNKNHETDDYHNIV